MEYINSPQVPVGTKKAALKALAVGFQIKNPKTIDLLLHKYVIEKSISYPVLDSFVFLCKQSMNRNSEKSLDKGIQVNLDLIEFLASLSSNQRFELAEYTRCRGDMIGSSISMQSIWDNILVPGWLADDPDNYWQEIYDYISLVDRAQSNAEEIVNCIVEITKFMKEHCITIETLYKITMSIKKSGNDEDMYEIYSALRQEEVRYSEVQRALKEIDREASPYRK